jgi:hypothetical protein
MPKFCNLTNERFGRLTVVKHVGRNSSKRQVWECLCNCGNTHKADSAALTTGHTTSCGCYLKERITKHGGTGKASYNTWRAMMRRCYTVTDKDYPKYGGKGVTVHSAWHTYTIFAADMGEPSDRETLDRIDPYGGYNPNNCRWASPTLQARNTRTRLGKSGYRGVYVLPGNKWMAAISADHKKYYGKCRDTVEEAVADRKELEHLHWGASSGT